MSVAGTGVLAMSRELREVDGRQCLGGTLAIEGVEEAADDASRLAAGARGEGDLDHREVFLEELGVGFEAVLHHPPEAITGEDEDQIAQGKVVENHGLFVRGGPSWARTRDLSLIRTAL